MDMLKKLFPFSFGADDIKPLAIKVVVYIAVAFVVGLILALAAQLTDWIPVVGTAIGVLLSIIGWICEIYVVGGIVVTVLDYLKILK